MPKPTGAQLQELKRERAAFKPAPDLVPPDFSGETLTMRLPSGEVVQVPTVLFNPGDFHVVKRRFSARFVNLEILP